MTFPILMSWELRGGSMHSDATARRLFHDEAESAKKHGLRPAALAKLPDKAPSR
jgi:hypothetical protein